MIILNAGAIFMKTDIDFNEVVRELLKGRTQLELQDITGVHQGVISDLKSGKPKPNLTYINGAALVKAHQELCQKKEPELEEA
jgi:predicted transcriptional regulator